MIDTEIIEVKNGAALGVRVNLQKMPLIMIIAEKGYMTCGYFDPATVEKWKDCAVVVRGVGNWEEMLRSKVTYVSRAAQKLRINENMTGRQALEKMI